MENKLKKYFNKQKSYKDKKNNHDIGLVGSKIFSDFKTDQWI